jgi:hypothetical protein
MSSLKFYVKPAPGERVESTLTLPPSQAASIYGVVQTADGTPARGCVVLLYDEHEPAPLAQAFTNEEGQFCFGPLVGDRLYIINIYYDDAQIRTLEITV